MRQFSEGGKTGLFEKYNWREIQKSLFSRLLDFSLDTVADSRLLDDDDDGFDVDEGWLWLSAGAVTLVAAALSRARSRFFRPFWALLNDDEEAAAAAATVDTLSEVRHDLSSWYWQKHLVQKSKRQDLRLQCARFSAGITRHGKVHRGQERNCSSGPKREASSAKTLCLNLLGLPNMAGGSGFLSLLAAMDGLEVTEELAMDTEELEEIDDGSLIRDSSAMTFETFPRAFLGLVLSNLAFLDFDLVFEPCVFSDHFSLASFHLVKATSLVLMERFHKVETCKAKANSSGAKQFQILFKM